MTMKQKGAFTALDRTSSQACRTLHPDLSKTASRAMVASFNLIAPVLQLHALMGPRFAFFVSSFVRSFDSEESTTSAALALSSTLTAALVAGREFKAAAVSM